MTLRKRWWGQAIAPFWPAHACGAADNSIPDVRNIYEPEALATEFDCPSLTLPARFTYA
jgi:hypothetical protein